MNDPSILHLSNVDLDVLLRTLTIDFLSLSECLVSPGWRLTLEGPHVTGIHYSLTGAGRLTAGDQPPIELQPDTLVILPAGAGFTVEVPADGRPAARSVVVSGTENAAPSVPTRHVAGDAEPGLILICGYFQASYGVGIDLFSALRCPIVQQFSRSDLPFQTLKAALAELVAQEVGFVAMTAALLKQVLVMLLRRSWASVGLWAACFSLFRDPSVARAFADMARRPAAAHSLMSLAGTAGLSRSAFAARFTAVFGASPMTVLRRLRLRQAAELLEGKALSVKQIAGAVGYSSRSSFVRAFRETYGVDPTKYRTGSQAPTAASRELKAPMA